ncbi:regulatory protein GemA [Gallaecimonas kandeliae]|uniref:gp16 family protein n=1 Tax=Gallaecimonas kandeliae TaxID=3029055 RepID=UPI00264A266B|nr:regulatory protein GemA [Gallaecimonas kandeliae]WKE64357.1 regulatory protein GemA [Gallaecimonas kandeliae]
MASKQQITLIHVARSQLGLEEEVYRQILVDITGKDSSKALTLKEADQVLAHFEQKGFKRLPKQGSNGKRQSPKAGQGKHPAVDKLRAIWITMARQGIVRDGSETALDKWAAKVTGIQHVGWLKGAKAEKALEALKQWHGRELERPLARRWPMLPESSQYATLADYRRLNDGRWYETLCDLAAKYSATGAALQ